MLERAQALVRRADGIFAEAEALRGRADTLRQAAEAALDEVGSWEPEARKLPHWQSLDQAESIGSARPALGAGVHRDPRRGTGACARTERGPPAPRGALPTGAPGAGSRAAIAEPQTAPCFCCAVTTGGSSADYLAGLGWLTMHTDPPGRRCHALPIRGAEPPATAGVRRRPRLDAHRSAGTARGLVPDRAVVAGALPGAFVPCGSSVWVTGPASHRGRPRRARCLLPKTNEIPDDQVYVPATWMLAGGSAKFGNAVPRHAHWCEGFVIQRLPVTLGQYLEFLHALVDGGEVDRALALAPRERSVSPGEPGGLRIGWDGRRFCLVPDAQGHVWDADWPVMAITLQGMSDYAAWLARRDDLPWRLPREDEWALAMRGVDGRSYPWGDFLDPSWLCIRKSPAPGKPMLPAARGRIPRRPQRVRRRGCCWRHPRGLHAGLGGPGAIPNRASRWRGGRRGIPMSRWRSCAPVPRTIPRLG